MEKTLAIKKGITAIVDLEKSNARLAFDKSGSRVEGYIYAFPISSLFVNVAFKRL